MPNVRIHLVFSVLLVLAACSSKSGGGPQAADESAAVTPVEVAQVKRAPIANVVTAEAVLYPIIQANIVPKITAPVQRFLVQRGDHVSEGQLLAVLEDRDLRAASQEAGQLYTQAQAAFLTTKSATMPDDFTKAKTDVDSARQALDAAQKVYDNRVALFREGALAQKLVDDAKVSLVQAQSLYDTSQQHLKNLEAVGRPEQLRSAQAQLDAAKAHYESAQAQLSYAEVRSPISGIVADRPINIGETASPGSALFSIVDISKVVARVNIPVHEAAMIRAGQSASISGPGGELTAKVTVVSPAADANTTTVQVWVQAANTGERLRPGITVQVAIDLGEIPDAVVGPAAALLPSADGGEKVLIAGADGLAHESTVQTGVRSGDQVQIVSGVKPGDQVIVQGGLGLDDKSKIKIEKPGEKSSDDKEAPGK